MSFMSQEQIRAVRLKGSKVVRLEHLDQEVRVIRMSSGRSIESGELQTAVRNGTKGQSDMILFMFEHSLAMLDGTPFTAEDARTIFNLLPMEELSQLVNTIGRILGEGTTLSAKPAEPLTAIEKKD